MAFQTLLRQAFFEMPPVTRAYTTACVLTTLSVQKLEKIPKGDVQHWGAHHAEGRVDPDDLAKKKIIKFIKCG
jgi:hypothetical protein